MENNIRYLIEYTIKGITPKYVDKSSIMVLNQKCIRNNTIDYTQARFHDEEKKFSEKKIVKIGDILINSTGQGTAGRCAFVKYLPKNYTVIVDSHILIVRIQDFYTAGCLSYILYSIEEKLQTFIDGSTGQGEFDKERFLNIIAPLPKKEERSKVYSILASLDKKIELNNKINQKLEAMAKMLYDYWFVQFDFPDANGKPYKSSGGKMVYNKELKREIPEGWEEKKIGILLANISESIKKSDLKYSDRYTPMDLLPMKKMSFHSYFTASKAQTSLIKYQKDDILIGAMRVYFHRVCIAPFDGITRTTTLVLRAKNKAHMPYLYQICNEERTIKIATKLSSGTQQPYVKWENNLENYQIVYPNSNELINNYSKITEPIINKVILNELENQKLTQLRDWLLPMLMNGQIKISEASNIVQDALMAAEPETGYGKGMV